MVIGQVSFKRAPKPIILPKWLLNAALQKVKGAVGGWLSECDLSQGWTEQRGAGPHIEFATRRLLDCCFGRQCAVRHQNLAEMRVRTECTQAFGTRDVRDGR